MKFVKKKKKKTSWNTGKVGVIHQPVNHFILQGPIDFEMPLPDVESLKPYFC